MNNLPTICVKPHVLVWQNYLCSHVLKQRKFTMLMQVVGAAGMLINTMGWVDGLGLELLLHTITAMKANIVLVVGEDRLLTQLQTKYQVCHPHPYPADP